MIPCFFLILGVGSALAGVSIRMPFQHPAGVTYSALAAEVPAIPSPLQYATATTSSVAYGNGAFLGRSFVPAASPYTQYHAPVAHVAAPVAYHAAPVASSLVPTVHHVPAVAQVPVTKYEAQPAYVQNLVDIAKPKLATRKIEIRRPAIQKQFYDVEERVIVRPVGSAVVELDQPLSKSQKGPTVVQPALHAVAPVAAAPVVGLRSLHTHHHIASASYPASVSYYPYPIQGPAFAYPTATHAPSHGVAEQEQQQEHHHEQQEQPQEQPQGQEQQQFLQEQQQFQQEQQQQFQQEEQQQFQQEQQQQFQQEQQQQFQQEQQQQFQQEQQQQFQQQQPQFPSTEQPEFDDSDSLAIDNPEISRVRSQPAAPQQFNPQQAQAERENLNLQRTGPQLFNPQQQQILADFQSRAQQRVSGRQQNIASSQLQAQEQVVAQLQAQTQIQQEQLMRSQQLLELQQRQLTRSKEVANSFSRGVSQPAQTQALTRAQPASNVQQISQQNSFSVDVADVRSAVLNNLARSGSSPSVIPSVRISQEQSLDNQERLISLLTSRGGVVEARSNGEPGNHDVRARVLSVTPAPEGAAPQEEKVNTRRIVVNRPIQTVEEVNVVEPFTKIERVAVHSPAVIKTARVGVAHVPTSLPVQGYAHAIHATAIPAYLK